MNGLRKSITRRFMSGGIREHETTPGSIPTAGTSQEFISDCLQVLDSTTAGTAIYILSYLCPEGMDVILNLLRLDLSQPHHHRTLSKPRVHAVSSSYASVISHLRAYTTTLPPEAYNRLWLEVAHCWLLTCPLDREYYQPDESGNDMFCHKLRSELIESVLRLD